MQGLWFTVQGLGYSHAGTPAVTAAAHVTSSETLSVSEQGRRRDWAAPYAIPMAYNDDYRVSALLYLQNGYTGMLQRAGQGSPLPEGYHNCARDSKMNTHGIPDNDDQALQVNYGSLSRATADDRASPCCKGRSSYCEHWP